MDDEVEIVQADASVCLATAEVVYWEHPKATCLTGRDLSDFDYLSVTKEGFVPTILKPNC